MLEKKPFVKYDVESKKETFPVRITDDMKDWFMDAKR